MKVYKECCKNCLLSPDAIVSPKRRAELLRDVVRNQGYFVCHKATMREEEVCCKSFYDNLGHTSQLIRIAQRLNVVEFVDLPDQERLISHRDTQSKEV